MVRRSKILHQVYYFSGMADRNLVYVLILTYGTSVEVTHWDKEIRLALLQRILVGADKLTDHSKRYFSSHSPGEQFTVSGVELCFYPSRLS